MAPAAPLATPLSQPGYPNGGVPQGTLSVPNNFLVYVNDLRTTCSMYKYVDDSTIFEICKPTSVSVLQQSAAIIAVWSIDNGMRINTMKTKEIRPVARGVHMVHVNPPL